MNELDAIGEAIGFGELASQLDHAVRLDGEDLSCTGAGGQESKEAGAGAEVGDHGGGPNQCLDGARICGGTHAIGDHPPVMEHVIHARPAESRRLRESAGPARRASDRA